MTNTNKELEQKEMRIRILESQLTSVNSPIGDWKIAKCLEYKMVGLELPYDINVLNKQRQTVRDEINQLQEEIAEIIKIQKE